ncbi:hypothetical protein AC578_1527 [Pseudocercospora eumusae]|uniref:YCII-related domain-containing protein n=1 Tax=Pseudocercospora eumusae TaxID=321146 RepID=A0A139GXT8_9PEZI|nr:hypothetical protein AC578_1527 [Pseudocercospora eumusae]
MNTWLVHIPTAPGPADEDQAKIQYTHTAHNKSLLAAGKIVFGGEILGHQEDNNEDPSPGGKVTGNAFVVQADTETDVWTMIQDDPYAKSGNWKVVDAKVTPVKVTVIRPL